MSRLYATKKRTVVFFFFTIVSLPLCLCQRSSAKQDAKMAHFMALCLNEMKTAFFFFFFQMV